MEDSVKPASRRRRYRGLLVGLLAAAMLALLVIILLPSGNSEPSISPRLECGSHLRQIGQAILLYCNDHQSRYPDSLAELLSYLMEDGIDSDAPRMFICPCSADIPATGPTTRAIAANLQSGGHLSYIYVGRELTDKMATANTVVAFEPLSNHRDGMNVLFGDGQVDFLSKSQAEPIIAQWRDGKFPVTTPVKNQ